MKPKVIEEDADISAETIRRIIRDGNHVQIGAMKAVVTTLEGEGREDYIAILVPCDRRWKARIYEQVNEWLTMAKVIGGAIWR